MMVVSRMLIDVRESLALDHGLDWTGSSSLLKVDDLSVRSVHGSSVVCRVGLTDRKCRSLTSKL